MSISKLTCNNKSLCASESYRHIIRVLKTLNGKELLKVLCHVVIGIGFDILTHYFQSLEGITLTKGAISCCREVPWVSTISRNTLGTYNMACWDY